MANINTPAPSPLTMTQWLICVIAAIGFAFDIYELLMAPLVFPSAIAELTGVAPGTPEFSSYFGKLFYLPALFGGLFGLLGGYLTDRFGRRRVLTYSILLYAVSAFAAGFSTSFEMLLFFRITTFIGVCVEFVAAVAWLAELFPHPAQREKVLGYTQAFSSIGGLLVAFANYGAVKLSGTLPVIGLPDGLNWFGGSIADPQAPWRYTLISGLIPAIPLIIIRPFLPESPVWLKKKAEGTLKRPSLAALFAPEFRRTTIVTTLMFACVYGAAFGAIQQMPRMLSGLPAIQAKSAAAGDAAIDGKPEVEHAKLRKVAGKREVQANRAKVTKVQEIGGLIGRALAAILLVCVVTGGRASAKVLIAWGVGGAFLIAEIFGEFGGSFVDHLVRLGIGLGTGVVGGLVIWWLAQFVQKAFIGNSPRNVVRTFQIPGLILMPLIFGWAAVTDLNYLYVGMFLAGLLTVGQFSFWGNYLPRLFPTHLRGTGESMAANVGGRMIGTSFAWITSAIAVQAWVPGDSAPTKVAYTAAGIAFVVYAVGFILSFFLPPPRDEELTD